MDSDLAVEVDPLGILDEAESWIGTPWRRAKCIKGRGVDCLNFVGGVFKARGILTHVPTRDYHQRFWENSKEDLLQEGIDEGMTYLATGYLVMRGLAVVEHLLPGDMLTHMCLKNDDRATHATFFHHQVANQIWVIDARAGRGGKVDIQPIQPTWRLKDYYRIVQAPA